MWFKDNIDKIGNYYFVLINYHPDFLTVTRMQQLSVITS